MKILKKSVSQYLKKKNDKLLFSFEKKIIFIFFIWPIFQTRENVVSYFPVQSISIATLSFPSKNCQKKKRKFFFSIEIIFFFF